MRRARVAEAPPTRALVIGDGPIGLLVTILLARAGTRDVTLVGGREARLALGRDLGATATVNYHKRDDVDSEYALVVEASGSASGVAMALRAAALGARVMVIGDYGSERADFPWNHLLHRELELIGSNAGAGAWPEAVGLAVSGKLPLQRLISRRLPARHFAEAFELVRSSRDTAKVVLDW